MPSDPENRPPRGALIVIAVGLLATIVAALLANPNASAGAAELEWEMMQPLPDSRAVAIPGGGAVQLVDAGLRASGLSVSGYQLFRVAAVLAISKGAPVGSGRVVCAVKVPPKTLVAHTPSNRGSYPRPSEEDELVKQEVPERVLVGFNAKGADAVVVGLGDAFDEFVDERGVTVSWSPFRIQRQGWQWGLPSGRPHRQLELGFASIWRTTATPKASISCKLMTSAGSVQVSAAGAITQKPEPIAE